MGQVTATRRNDMSTELSILPPGTLTMSSREIADLTGKDHKHVLADIRTMLDQLGKRSADFSADVPDSYGRQQPGFNLPYHETMVLLTGYSAPMRSKVLARWQVLEARTHNPLHGMSELEKVGAWLEQATGRKAAEAALVPLQSSNLALAQALEVVGGQLADTQPKADAFDKMAARPGDIGVREAAYRLGLAQKAFTGWAMRAGLLYRDGRNRLRAKAEHVATNRFVHRVHTVQGDDGVSESYFQVLITSEGLAYMRLRIDRDGIDEGAPVSQLKRTAKPPPQTPPQSSPQEPMH